MPVPTASDCGEECSAALASYIYNDFLAAPGTLDTSDQSCQEQGKLSPPQLRRLTSREYKATIVSVFGDIFPDTAWPSFGDALPTLGMSNNANLLSINSLNFESIYMSVDVIVETLLTSEHDLGTCLDTETPEQCIKRPHKEYGAALWRRPLTAEDRKPLDASLARLAAAGGSPLDQMAFDLKALLLSPNFLYRHEIGKETEGISELDSYEIASLLSYSIIGGPPDQKLMWAAAKNELVNPADIEKHVARLIESQEFGQQLLEFYKDFLKVDNILTVPKQEHLNLTSSMRDALLKSIELSIESEVGDLDQPLMAAINSNNFFVNDLIAPLFGLTSDSLSGELALTEVSIEERNGLLTHPAFLTTHSKEGSSGIVRRGLFTLLQMSCQELGAPPEVLTEAALPVDMDPDTTSSRELLHLRHSSQAECSVCHKTIDPAGFGYENFDALGRYRTIEKDVVPIDASGSLTLGAETLNFSNSVEFTGALMSSNTLKACLTKRYFERFSGASLKQSSCENKKLQASTLSETATIRDIIQSISQLESLRLRGNQQ